MLSAPRNSLQPRRAFGELDDESQTAYETFERYGNHFPSGGLKPSLAKLSDGYPVPGFNVQVQQQDPESGKPVNVTFDTATVNLRHVGERHSLPFFQFHNKPENTFFKSGGSIFQLKEAVAAGALTVQPLVHHHLEHCDMEQWEIPYASTDDEQPPGTVKAGGTGLRFGDLYFDFKSEMTQEAETDQAISETYRLKIKSMAPLEGTDNAISFSQDALDEVVTWRDEE